MFCYCKKCGRTIECIAEETDYICDCCGAYTFIIPSVYMPDGLNSKLTERYKNALMEDLVKTSPEFDQYLFDHKEEILAKKAAELDT